MRDFNESNLTFKSNSIIAGDVLCERLPRCCVLATPSDLISNYSHKKKYIMWLVDDINYSTHIPPALLHTSFVIQHPASSHKRTVISVHTSHKMMAEWSKSNLGEWNTLAAWRLMFILSTLPSWLNIAKYSSSYPNTKTHIHFSSLASAIHFSLLFHFIFLMKI